MSDYLQPQDLIDDKKHSKFFAEVITGKAGGVAGGSTIDTATNSVTSQVQKTMPKIMGDAVSAFNAQISAHELEHDNQISAHEVEHDNQIAAHEAEFIAQLQAQGWNPVAGSFEAGGAIVNRRDILWWEAAMAWYSWQGTIPLGGYVVAAGSTPATAGGVSSTAWVDRTDGALRNEISALISVSSKSELENIASTIDGAMIRVANSYGVDHIRQLSVASDGSTGILTAGGLYANLLITKPRTIYMSQLFVAGSSDQTDLIFNKLPAKITGAGITNVVLDTGDVTILGNTTLPEVYNKVTFSGIGKLLTKTRDNILQRIQSEKTDSKKYHGQYNLGAVYNAISKARIMKAKEFRVVLFGDSISVGSDYDSFGSIPSGDRATTGVDNTERNNCLAATIFNELCSIMPAGVRVKFYSRSIGGLAYGNIDQAWDSLGALWTGRDGVVAGRSWRDCVLALNPDLVIHSMGMNESPTTYLDNFKTKWADYIASDAVQKSVTFDQAILTTPNPNFIDAAPYGDFKTYNNNASKFFVAAMQRYVARRYNYSLIDVAFNSYLKRYGFDCRSVNFSATAQPYVFPDGTASHVVSAGEVPGLSQVTPTDLPLYWSTQFVLNSSAASNTTGFAFSFEAGNIILQFAASELTLYSGIYGGAGSFFKVVNYVLPAGVNTRFDVTVTPTSIYVYIGGVLTIASNNVPFNSTLPMQFNNSGGNAAVTVVSGATFSQQFARYGQDAVTNGDYYGVLSYTSNPNGGGVNHPSCTMLAEIYLPPVREFLTALLTASVEYDSVVGGTSAGQMVYVGRILGKQYNKVSIKDRGSTRETIVTMNSSSTWTVNKNTGGAVSVYIDPVDLAVFIYNPSDPVLQIEYTGDWIVKRVEKLGLTTPRGTLLSTVA